MHRSMRRLAGLLALAASVPATAQPERDPLAPGREELMTALCETPVRDGTCMRGGRELTYWLAFDTIVDGRKWHTAIATAQAQPSSESGGARYFAPGEMLSLSQVTYVLEKGRWTFKARQIDFGSIESSGAAGNPPMVDEATAPFRQNLGDGTLVGYPTRTLANEGISMSAYSMFRSQPDMSGRWIYAGDIASGSDNGAGCNQDEAPETCYASTGVLDLTGKTVAGWPEVKVSVSGRVPGANGKVRNASKADGALWRFDVAKAAYSNAKAR